MRYEFTPKYIERFWQKVDRSGGSDACWPWLACSTNPGGHGWVWMGDAGYVASRVAYIVTYGPIPRELRVCHHCDNPPCCNPKHLFAGTQADNLADMTTKGRRARVGVVGEAHPKAKLTNADVVTIRERHAAGGISYSALGREYAVTHTCIRDICLHEIWKHIK
jgi:hypothetical protein